MAIKLKTQQQIELMRRAGCIVYRVLQHMREIVEPGITTAQLDIEAERLILAAGGQPLFKGVPNPRAGDPFPASTCISIDNEIVHGIPSSERSLQEGQIVSIDCGVRYEGYCGDAAVTVPVGKVEPKVARLLEVTQRVLQIAVDNIKPGVLWSQIAAKMQSEAEGAGFSVVREFVGHGIGVEMHEDPKVPNFVSNELLRNDILLKPGMVVAVEPMINMAGWATKRGRDGWVVLTRDGSRSAHFEHTIAVTQTAADVLTDGR